MSTPLPAASLELALYLAAVGWHIVPLSATSKRPLANCSRCHSTARPGSTHPIETCPCLPAGRWCHGVRAATTDPARLSTWWQRQPDAVPGVAAGPSGLILLDLDAHDDPLPADPATGLLPGIDLTGDPALAEPARIRTGLHTLALLARVRGGVHPWPAIPEHQPVVATTPSGGRHLWYRAPTANLRQALGKLGWQIDIKAGWNYGLAPGATTSTGTYHLRSGDPASPGRLPEWLAHEVLRVTAPAPIQPRLSPTLRRERCDGAPAAYLTTVLSRGAAHLATLTDGRQRALSALAYHAGGLLAWSGLPEHQVSAHLITAGEASGLPTRLAIRIVHRALLRGVRAPLSPPSMPMR
ncbi:bifunctional DNA primase/polymerase [Planobispora siamensis]|uniref:DNA primase/polymerase bifunctional N-terminal domain-containing protein n=1 Tax=Planobispora siamensis TaxID=936338 RepID=A0A8J3WGY2_9ACTN|nr:bifunctional DNA primase/polymerase [Planobispora siamensis]GIH89899.1 hypothetical protein Psi01_05290 [Planobispora siamensis]